MSNEWGLNEAGVKRELLDTVKARKLAYYGHTMRKQGNCLEKAVVQGTMPGVRRRGRPRSAWIDNIKSWTGLSVEESIRMTEDRDKWRKYVYGKGKERKSIYIAPFRTKVHTNNNNNNNNNTFISIPP